ncbi:MAG: AMP-binding protein [Pseudomonadota bacterium]
MSEHLPLLRRDLADPFASVAGQPIDTARFLADAQAIATRLPGCPQLIPVAEHRYDFQVLFAAALLRGSTCLLPARRDARGLATLAEEFPDAKAVHLTGAGTPVEVPSDAGLALSYRPGNAGAATAIPTVPADQCAAIAFTSGSTGESQRHAKSWALLYHSARLHWSQLPAHWQQPARLVCTVPPWHMYGFEWSVLVPWHAPLTVYCGADFYPDDVRRAVDADGLTVLVATPVHLKALARLPHRADGVRAPAAKPLLTLSATAPLTPELGRTFSDTWGSELLEIYGCSEIGSLACRNPLNEEAFRFFPWLTSRLTGDRLQITSPYLDDTVTLADRFAAAGERSFRLQGRTGDLVKVGGKRTSLGALNAALLAIDGVDDGIFYVPSHFDLPDTGRLAALVVSRSLDPSDVRRRLAQRIEPAFLPRPLRRIGALPRDPSSKLPAAALRELLHRLQRADDRSSSTAPRVEPGRPSLHGGQ